MTLQELIAVLESYTMAEKVKTLRDEYGREVLSVDIVAAPKGGVSLILNTKAVE